MADTFFPPNLSGPLLCISEQINRLCDGYFICEVFRVSQDFEVSCVNSRYCLWLSFVLAVIKLMEKKKEDKIISIDLEDDNDGDNDVDNDSDDGNDDDNDDDDNNDGNGNDDINQSSSDNSNLQSENNSGSINGQKTKQKITRAVKEILTNNNTKFMSDFDPELSNRERRKLTRKFNSEGKKIGTISDENGLVNVVEKDICDCLVEDCPGCHFPCPKCRSCKCGVECRVNRKWMYEAIENETEVTVPKNVDNSPD